MTNHHHCQQQSCSFAPEEEVCEFVDCRISDYEGKATATPPPPAMTTAMATTVVRFNEMVTVHVLPKRKRYLTQDDCDKLWWSSDELDTIVMQCGNQVEHLQQQQQVVDNHQQFLTSFRGLEYVIYHQRQQHLERNDAVQFMLETQQFCDCSDVDFITEEYKKLVDQSMERALITAYYDEFVVREYLRSTGIEFKQLQRKQMRDQQQAQMQGTSAEPDSGTLQDRAYNIKNRIRQTQQRIKRRVSIIRAARTSPSMMSSLTLSGAMQPSPSSSSSSSSLPQLPPPPPPSQPSSLSPSQSILRMSKSIATASISAASTTIVSPLQQYLYNGGRNYDSERRRLRNRRQINLFQNLQGVGTFNANTRSTETNQ